MRKIRYYILSSILFLSISCVNDIRKAYNNFRHETINFPAMIKVENREIKPYNTHYGIPKMIFYFDSLECNHCRIEHLLDYHIIYKTTENAPEFDVMIIFSPRQDDYDSVVEELMIHDFPFPIYIDFNGEFRKQNYFIPSDRRFHSFLLDGSGHPVFIGNPIASDSMSSLFDRALEELK